MSDVTLILSQIDSGDPVASERLLPLVYDELRKLAAARLARENPGQTLQATALVHEAYLRLVQGDRLATWNSRGHFFGAAAEAMRRILIEQARRKDSEKAGGQFNLVALSSVEPEIAGPNLDILILSEALDQLARLDPRAAQVVKLRFFAGLTTPQAAQAIGVSLATAENDWAYAKSWLKLRLTEADPADP